MPGAFEREARGARAEHGVGLGGGLERGARIAVPGLADVVERQHGAPAADPDALEDPGVVGADLEQLEEAVADLGLGMGVPQSVQMNGQARLQVPEGRRLEPRGAPRSRSDY